MNEDKDFELMTLKELKSALRARKIPTKGTKEELQERLKLAMEQDEESEDELSSESEGKTPLSTSIPKKTARSHDVDDFAPISERPVEPPKDDIAKDETPPFDSVASVDQVVPEWRSLHIPDDWLPMPLIRISNLPTDAELDALRSILLEKASLSIAHLAFDSKPGGRSTVALLRLKAPQEELFAEGTAAEECDVKAIAEAEAKKLRSLDLALMNRKLEFEAPLCRTTLFVHNLKQHYGNKDDLFHSEMAKIGDLVRCFIVRNKQGESKDYGFVEYLLPADAMAAKDILDKKSADALSEFKRTRNLATNSSAMVPLKRLRCEWAFNPNIPSMYSKICYVSNLPPNFEDREVLRNVFAPFGTVLSCNIRTRPGMGPGCGFVDFEKGEEAEKALRTLDESKNSPLGYILVSFVNPGKFPGDTQTTATNAIGPYTRPVYPKRNRGDMISGSGGQFGGFIASPNRNQIFSPGRPGFEGGQRGRHRPTARRPYRGYPFFGGYPSGMYGAFYNPYGPGFMQPGYVSNGGYAQFPPQAPYPPPYPAPSNTYVDLQSTLSVEGPYGEQDYHPHETYGGQLAYNGSSYGGGTTPPPSQGGSYQAVNQTVYPSNYGGSYHSLYGQGSGASYPPNQSANGSYTQGGYSQVYGGGSLHGSQIPGTKREPDYEGGGSYGSYKKARY